MPFNALNLSELVASDDISLWFYRTTDTRAAVLAPGYFVSVADRLLSGHIIICRASDSMAFLPVRTGGAVGNGLVLDSTAAPLRLTVALTQRFTPVQTLAASFAAA
jgi:hypothetical protein